MKNKWTRVFVCVTVLAALLMQPLSAQKHYKDLDYPKVGKIEIPQSKMVQLDNGMTIILMEDHELPFIKMHAEYFAGSFWGDPDDKVGLAGMTGEVMRTGGSVSKSGDVIDEELEAIAASVETWIDNVYGGASCNTLKDHFDKVSQIFADVLLNPAFPEEKIELAKVQWKSGISRRNDDATGIADREFNRLIYAGTPFERLSEYATVDAITQQDMINYHKKWVRPNGFILGVWGDFKTGDMVKKLEKLFGAWKPVEVNVSKRIQIPYDYRSTVNLIEKRDVNQSSIYVGHIGGSKNIPEYAAMVMCNEIFGGGFSSRLFSRLRSDQGLAYAVDGGFNTHFFHPGTFYGHIQTRSERTAEAIRSMQKEIRLMTEELVTEDELERARESWLNSYVFNFDQVDKTARRLVQYAYNEYPDDFLQELRKKIEAVTREDILAAAKKYIRPDQLQILVVGNPDDFDEPLSVFGEVNVIDITIPVPVSETIAEADPASLEKGKALMTKSLDAMGGVEKIQAVRNSTVKMTVSAKTPMGDMTMEGEGKFLYPDKINFKMTMPMGEVSLVLNGDKGVLTHPGGTMPMPEVQKTGLLEGLFRDPVTMAKNLESLKVIFVGETDFDGKTTQEILITDGKNAVRFYLDSESLLPIGASYSGMTQAGPTQKTDSYSDYQVFDGLNFWAKTVTMAGDEKESETVYTEMKFDEEINPDDFVVE